MEFKNAITVCLISFFSAALVVLIARSLDVQAASKLQPELAQISKELQALRAQLAGSELVFTGDGSSKAAFLTASEITDGLIVYYAHSNNRCFDCRNMERQAHAALKADFADELREGKIVWQTINYMEPEGTFLVTDYNVQTPTVLLVRMKDGQIAEGKNLDESFALIKGPTEKFIEYVQDEVQTMLEASDASDSSTDDSSDAALDIPLPTP